MHVTVDHTRQSYVLVNRIVLLIRITKGVDHRLAVTQVVWESNAELDNDLVTKRVNLKALNP